MGLGEAAGVSGKRLWGLERSWRMRAQGETAAAEWEIAIKGLLGLGFCLPTG